MPTVIILVRHGESRANNEKFFAGQLDVELSPLGHKQAEITAKYIADNYKVDRIYSSPLSRAYDTAMAISSLTGMEIIPRDELCEINSGEWQGLHFDELQGRYADSYGIWLSDIGKAQPPSGESVKELYERIWQAVKDISNENPDRTVVVSTHATPIRAILCRLHGKMSEDMKDIPWSSNASIAVIKKDFDGWKISLEDFDEHLSDLKTRFPTNV